MSAGSGNTLMCVAAFGRRIRLVRRFLLSHTHTESECAAAFAAWSGVDSALRHRTTIAGCEHGDHRVFWVVEAENEESALELLPGFVAARTEVTPVREVLIP
jgi:hypothetical protein